MLGNMTTAIYAACMEKQRYTNTALLPATANRLRALVATQTLRLSRRVVASELIDGLITLGQRHANELDAILTKENADE